MSLEDMVLAALAKETNVSVRFKIACMHGLAKPAVDMLLAMERDRMELSFDKVYGRWFPPVSRPHAGTAMGTKDSLKLMARHLEYCDMIDLEVLFAERQSDMRELVRDIVERFVRKNPVEQAEHEYLKTHLAICDAYFPGTELHRELATLAMRQWVTSAVGTSYCTNFLHSFPIQVPQQSPGPVDFWFVPMRDYLLKIGVDQAQIDVFILKLFAEGHVKNAGAALALGGIYDGDLDAFMKATRKSAAGIFRGQLFSPGNGGEFRTTHFHRLVGMGVFSSDWMPVKQHRRDEYNDICVELLAEGHAGVVFDHMKLFPTLWGSDDRVTSDFARLVRRAFPRAVVLKNYGIAFALAQTVMFDEDMGEQVYELYQLAVAHRQRMTLNWNTVVVPPNTR